MKTLMDKISTKKMMRKVLRSMLMEKYWQRILWEEYLSSTKAFFLKIYEDFKILILKTFETKKCLKKIVMGKCLSILVREMHRKKIDGKDTKQQIWG